MTDHHTEQLALYLNARDGREYGTAAWGDLDLAGQEAYLTDATAIVAAMKALGWAPAHTPTDDEREALTDLIAEERDKWPRVSDDMDSEELADVILAAGFRRTVPEPSDAEREALILDLKAVAGIMKFLGYKERADTVLRAVEALCRTEEDERIEAWHYVADLGAFKACYDEEQPLIDSVLARITQLHELETTVNELAPQGEPSDACRHDDFSSQQIGSGMVRMTCHDCGETITNGVNDEHA